MRSITKRFALRLKRRPELSPAGFAPLGKTPLERLWERDGLLKAPEEEETPPARADGHPRWPDAQSDAIKLTRRFQE